MARYTGPKNKLARKVGEDLNLKTNAIKSNKRISIRPGQHGNKGRKKLSGFGQQLKEKQKLKYVYGVLEKQLRNLYEVASKNPTATGAALLGLLERRLDNVVYRLGWVPTRAAARQLVAHGHVVVNDRKVLAPSYRVKVKDVIMLRQKATSIPTVSALLKDEVSNIPTWLKRKGPAGSIERLPERTDIDSNIDEQLIVEFYSR
ncbi:MAG TPA: 30S ribosomal protein S4 [Vitreimonas sp.]|nr:30S ribosomal protein S4 [Vitreimonas sp.]